MNYKVTFNLKNGIKGEADLTAESDGDAFITACKMFEFEDTVEWRVDKVEEIKMSSADRLKAALKLTSEAYDLAESEYDNKKDALERMTEKERERNGKLEELVDKLDEALDGLASAKDDLTKALKAV